MFSVSPAEMLTIAVVALLVFGPRRLPEIARRAGRVLRRLRDAAEEMKAGLEAEYGETLRPLDEVRREMSATRHDLIDGVPPRPHPPPPESPAGAGEER